MITRYNYGPWQQEYIDRYSTSCRCIVVRMNIKRYQTHQRYDGRDICFPLIAGLPSGLAISDAPGTPSWTTSARAAGAPTWWSPPWCPKGTMLGVWSVLDTGSKDSGHGPKPCLTGADEEAVRNEVKKWQNAARGFDQWLDLQQ